jgi:excinuclease ABC subunit B
LENQKVRKLELVDPVNLKIISQEKEIIVMPFKHFISTQPDIERAVKEIKKELKERLEFFKKKWQIFGS